MLILSHHHSSCLSRGQKCDLEWDHKQRECYNMSRVTMAGFLIFKFDFSSRLGCFLSESRSSGDDFDELLGDRCLTTPVEWGWGLEWEEGVTCCIEVWDCPAFPLRSWWSSPWLPSDWHAHCSYSHRRHCTESLQNWTRTDLKFRRKSPREHENVTYLGASQIYQVLQPRTDPVWIPHPDSSPESWWTHCQYL